jgi:hypothetical protein
MTQRKVAAAVPAAPGTCEAKARLESRYKIAIDAFDIARSAVRGKVGTSSKAEFLMLDRQPI